MAHTNAWSEIDPANADDVRLGAADMRENLLDIRERMEIEHVWNDGIATDGQHLPGRCGVLYFGTTIQIAALVAPPDGSVAFDTDLNMFKYCDTGIWTLGHLDYVEAAPTIVITDTDEVAPAGRYRIINDSDALIIQGRNAADLAWVDIITMDRLGPVTLVGALAMGAAQITGLADGTAAGEALHAGQVDDATLEVAAGVLQAKDGGISAAKMGAGVLPVLGAWDAASYATGVSYLAATDGFIIATGKGNTPVSIQTDAADPPGTTRASVYGGFGLQDYTVTSPVKAGDYFKCNNATVGVHWIPLD